MAVTTVSKGSIIFVDTTKVGSSTVHFQAADYESPITTASLDTLADALVAVSDCGLKAEHVIDQAREDEPTYTGNKDRKGLVVAQEPDGTVHKWEVPGIKVASCEIVEGTKGERIKPATATTLVAAIATCTGLTLVALPCPVIQTT